mgnify:CR=1 FL=1
MTRKRTKRRRWFIPALREGDMEPAEDGNQLYHRAPIPIMWFKDGPSKRYLAWLDEKQFPGQSEWVGHVTTGEWPRELMSDRFARFIQSADWPTTPSHDWVPVAPGFPARP